MSSPRYQKLSEQNLQEDMVWVKGVSGDPYIFRSAVVDIDAPLDVVWGVVQELNHYYEFSNHTIDIDLSGELALGSTFDIHLYPGTLKGFFIPTSTEAINVFNDEQHVLGWTRRLPCSSHYSQRYHVLEALPDNQGTRSSIVLRIPGSVGFFTQKFMGHAITHAFDELNTGIKTQAESLNITRL